MQQADTIKSIACCSEPHGPLPIWKLNPIEDLSKCNAEKLEKQNFK